MVCSISRLLPVSVARSSHTHHVQSLACLHKAQATPVCLLPTPYLPGSPTGYRLIVCGGCGGPQYEGAASSLSVHLPAYNPRLGWAAQLNTAHQYEPLLRPLPSHADKNEEAVQRLATAGAKVAPTPAALASTPGAAGTSLRLQFQQLQLQHEGWKHDASRTEFEVGSWPRPHPSCLG